MRGDRHHVLLFKTQNEKIRDQCNIQSRKNFNLIRANKGETGVFGEHHHHVCRLAGCSLPWNNWFANDDDDVDDDDDDDDDDVDDDDDT